MDFLGKKKIEQANQLYDEKKQEIDIKWNELKQKEECLNNKWGNCIAGINDNKRILIKDLFPKLKRQLTIIKESKIPVEYMEELSVIFTDIDDLSISYLQSEFSKPKNGFFKVVKDFIFLGFRARKEASDFEANVYGEIAKIDEDIAKCEAEIARFNDLETAIIYIDDCIDKMTAIFRELLIRFDSVLNSLKFISMKTRKAVKSSSLTLDMLPIIQIEEFKAVISMGLIMSCVVRKEIVCNESVIKDNEKMQLEYKEFMNKYNERLALVN